MCSSDLVELYLGHPIADMTDDERADLLRAWAAVRDDRDAWAGLLEDRMQQLEREAMQEEDDDDADA